MSAFVKKEKETKVDDRWAHVLCPEVVEHFQQRETIYTKPTKINIRIMPTFEHRGTTKPAKK